MPLSNLRKLALLDTDITENSREMQRVVNLCYNKPLYYSWWEPKHEQKYHKTNGNCCIWHILGPEKKDGKLMPMLPYQKLLYQTLQGHKCIWLKKSRGLGVTTFMLYYIAYLCLTVLNKVKVEVFPSHHIDTMRGLDRVKFILSDETDYYPPFQQKELRAVMEGYIGKPNSDPTIALVSTPKAPGGLMQQIELEQNSLYYKLFFDYTYGLEGPQPIYSVAQIEQAKRSPDFRREYAGEYLGLIGNCFNISSINRAVMHGTKYSELSQDNWTKGVHALLSIDPAYGSVSKYAIVMCQYLDQKIVVIYAKEYTKPDYSDMIDEVFRLSRQVGGVSNILVDNSAPEIIASLRRAFHKDQYSDNYIKEIMDNARKFNIPIENRLFVVPKSFATSGRQMLQHAVSIFDIPEGAIAIPPQYQDLIVSLRTTTAEEWKLDKANTSHKIVEG